MQRTGSVRVPEGGATTPTAAANTGQRGKPRIQVKGSPTGIRGKTRIQGTSAGVPESGTSLESPLRTGPRGKAGIDTPARGTRRCPRWRSGAEVAALCVRPHAAGRWVVPDSGTGANAWQCSSSRLGARLRLVQSGATYRTTRQESVAMPVSESVPDREARNPRTSGQAPPGNPGKGYRKSKQPVPEDEASRTGR